MARVHAGGQKTTDSPRSAGSPGGARGGGTNVPDGINLIHNEGKLLYLLSRYASAAPAEGGLVASGAASVEQWLRRVPLLVLVYEGITKQAFDYEFSPCLERVGVGSLWLHLNVAHEALTDLTVTEARELAGSGQFPAGSMGPKIEAACRFVEHGGAEAVICHTDQLFKAFHGGAGTRIRVTHAHPENA